VRAGAVAPNVAAPQAGGNAQSRLGNKADPDRAGGVEDKLYNHDKMEPTIAQSGARGSDANAILGEIQYLGSNLEKKTLKQAYEQTDQIGGNMNLNKSTTEQEEKWYKQMTDHHKESKRSIQNRGAVIPSVIYLACRYKGVAHTLIQEGDKTDVYKAFMRCKEVLGNEQEWDTLHSMPRTHEERNTFFREGGNEISFCHISLF
jgi:transcription initiation factor TFIIIB Brf1 subunit/transcription initiation factor TFIIB